MRIVFLGSGAFGLPTLRSLAASHELAGIVTQPDRPAGRKRVPTPTPVGAWAATDAPVVPLIKPENINEPTTLERVRALEADAWVVIAFGQKLSEPLLADRFAVNLHASLLPRWRGAAPINHAIVAGDRTTGNSVIALAQRMDAGVVYAQSSRPITPGVTAGELHDLLADDGPALVERVLSDLARGELTPAEQDESLVTLAPKLSKGDGWIDPAGPAIACRNRVHGLTPWPGVSAAIDREPVKLLRVNALERSPNKDAAPGVLVDAEAGVFACGEGALRIAELQPPGKRPMAWSDFARGRGVSAGAVLTSEQPC